MFTPLINREQKKQSKAAIPIPPQPIRMLYRIVKGFFFLIQRLLHTSYPLAYFFCNKNRIVVVIISAQRDEGCLELHSPCIVYVPG